MPGWVELVVVYFTGAYVASWVCGFYDGVQRKNVPDEDYFLFVGLWPLVLPCWVFHLTRAFGKKLGEVPEKRRQDEASYERFKTWWK